MQGNMPNSTQTCLDVTTYMCVLCSWQNKLVHIKNDNKQRTLVCDCIKMMKIKFILSRDWPLIYDDDDSDRSPQASIRLKPDMCRKSSFTPK